MKKTTLLLALLASVPLMGIAQTPEGNTRTSSIVGTWTLAGAEKLLRNGTLITDDYGPNPHGLVIFTADGYYSVQIYRDKRLKFSSGDKLKGTPQEYRDALLSTSVHFGRYSLNVANHTITFRIDRSSFPNQDDTTQVRAYVMKAGELSWKVAPRPDGSVPITILRRAGP
jgi:Lipocalin-like domain